MQNLEDIWTRRSNLIKTTDTTASTPEMGFDFSEGIYEHLRYSNDNHNDPMLQDFREFLHKLVFDFGYTDSFWKNKHYPERGTIAITADVVQGQAHVLIKVSGFGVYAISWYNRRSRLDAFVDLSTGQSITLEDLTHILYILGFEEDYETD